MRRCEYAKADQDSSQHADNKQSHPNPLLGAELRYI